VQLGGVLTCAISSCVGRSAINPIEFVYHAVPPEGVPKEEHSPNLHAISTHFNKVSLWVATEIVTARTPREQAAIWKRFIKLAKRLRGLNNFNTLMQVISGLGNAATKRLKQARALLSPKLLSQLSQLEAIFLPMHNFQNYRAAIQAASPPVLPYLAMYLRDLTYISDGNSTYLSVMANEPLPLNWEKQRLFWEHVQRLRTYFPDDRNPYASTIQMERVLRSYLLNLRVLDNENLYNHSRIMNPIMVREEPSTFTSNNNNHHNHHNHHHHRHHRRSSSSSNNNTSSGKNSSTSPASSPRLLASTSPRSKSSRRRVLGSRTSSRRLQRSTSGPNLSQQVVKKNPLFGKQHPIRPRS
jgi:RasGEF domain